jgi:hypothetical protein
MQHLKTLQGQCHRSVRATGPTCDDPREVPTTSAQAHIVRLRPLTNAVGMSTTPALSHRVCLRRVRGSQRPVEHLRLVESSEKKRSSWSLSCVWGGQIVELPR